MVVACSWLVKDWSDSFAVRFVLVASLSCMFALSIGVIVSGVLARAQRRLVQPVKA